MVDLSSNVAVLRRWALARPGEPLPANYSEWASEFPTEALLLTRKDPELVQLLSGTAPASLLADTLQGQLSPTPVSEAEREAEERKAEMQALYDASRSEAGLSLTQKIRLEAAYPELANKVKQETSIPAPAEADQLAWQQQAAQAEAEVRAASVARAMATTRRRF